MVEWLPVRGSKPRRQIPARFARILARDDGVGMGAQSRRASDAQAKRELGWTVRFPGWSQGSVTTYSSGTQPTAGTQERQEPAGTVQSTRAAKQ